MAAAFRSSSVSPGDAPVRQASVRAHNLALVLRHIAERSTPVSRAAIAGATGLTRATVSTLVEDLLVARLLAEVDPGPRAGAGRPAAGLVLCGDRLAGLGLEVNVDYLAGCVVDFAGRVRRRLLHRVDLRSAGPDRALSAVAELATTLRRTAEQDGLRLAGAALAVPGLVNDGVVLVAPNLGWHDVDAARVLRGCPDLRDLSLTVENEANLAALGELYAGGSGASTFVYISGEIGVGAGIVLGGALFRGARGWSGEVGHLTIQPDGPQCRCAARGCLEQYAGQEALLRQAGLAGPADAALRRLAERAEADQPDARHALHDAGRALGIALSGVVNLLDVDTIVLGGIYGPLEPWLRPALHEQLSRRVLTAAWSAVTVRPAALGTDAAVVGAAGSVVRAVRDDPTRWLA